MYKHYPEPPGFGQGGRAVGLWGSYGDTENLAAGAPRVSRCHFFHSNFVEKVKIFVIFA
jgi:hypothetical protein